MIKNYFLLTILIATQKHFFDKISLSEINFRNIINYK